MFYKTDTESVSLMKIKYLGTAAYEAIPSLFCECETCKKIREIGGKSVRTRSQAIINDDLLLDFPADTVAHVLYNNIDLSKVENCLITHCHSDHLYPADIGILKNGFAHPKDEYTFTLYATKIACDFMKNDVDMTDKARMVEVKEFDELKVGRYNVTVLPAIHGAASGPVIYQVSDGDKTLLYAHDTHFLHDDIWTFWEKTKPHFDIVSLDCTGAFTPIDYIGHMSVEENIEVKRRMLQMGIADQNTKFVCNHFSHNGANVIYEEFEPKARNFGLMTSFDGMEIEA